MTIQTTREKLAALVDLQVDPSLPAELTAAGVDPVTIVQVAGAVETAMEALDAELRARFAEAHAAAHPHDNEAAQAAQKERSLAKALRRATAEAASNARAGLDDRHGPVELAMADAGGAHEVADTDWYDD